MESYKKQEEEKLENVKSYSREIEKPVDVFVVASRLIFQNVLVEETSKSSQLFEILL